MIKRRVGESEKYVHFVTFSCYERRQPLQHDQAKRIVISQLGSRLAKPDGICTAYRWSSARWDLAGGPGGLSIRWPPGAETEDEFVAGL